MKPEMPITPAIIARSLCAALVGLSVSSCQSVSSGTTYDPTNVQKPAGGLCSERDFKITSQGKIVCPKHPTG